MRGRGHVSAGGISLGSELGPSAGCALSVAGESQQAHGVDKQLGRVELLGDAELGRGVVVRVLVMPVVPALAHRQVGYDGVLRRPALRVVRVIAVQVRGRVDQPGGV